MYSTENLRFMLQMNDFFLDIMYIYKLLYLVNNKTTCLETVLSRCSIHSFLCSKNNQNIVFYDIL